MSRKASKDYKTFAYNLQNGCSENIGKAQGKLSRWSPASVTLAWEYQNETLLWIFSKKMFQLFLGQLFYETVLSY